MWSASGVGHDGAVERVAIPKGHDRAELGEELLAVLAAVDQELAAAGRLDKDAVALADVEELDVQLAVGLGSAQATR